MVEVPELVHDDRIDECAEVEVIAVGAHERLPRPAVDVRQVATGRCGEEVGRLSPHDESIALVGRVRQPIGQLRRGRNCGPVDHAGDVQAEGRPHAEDGRRPVPCPSHHRRDPPGLCLGAIRR